MKVSININVNSNSFGGGISFAENIKKYLETKGETVIFHLDDNDIDIIFLLNITYNSSYSFYSALLYKYYHPEVIIVHRVNDSGLHRESGLLTYLMTTCSVHCDHIIYISEWLKEIMYPKMRCLKPYSIILNGGDNNIFNLNNYKKWNGKSKLKLVTHHWSSNYLKGHEIYQCLDRLLDNEFYGSRFEFTYIGNLPFGLKYRNTKLIPLLMGNELADELRNHHVYLTASQFEAAGMHHIEGALCGLPLLYLKSGGLPEYCQGYGVEFDRENFVEKLIQIHKEYHKFLPLIERYSNSAENMCTNYYMLFRNLIIKRNELSINKHTYSLNSIAYLRKYYFRIWEKIYYPYINCGGILHRHLHRKNDLSINL